MGNSGDLDEIVRRQSGIVTRAQAQRCGVPSRTFSQWCAKGGRWSAILPSVALTSRAAPTREQRIRAALLYCGDGAVLSGRDALERYALARVPPLPFILVVIPRRRRPRSLPSWLRVVQTTRDGRALTIGGVRVVRLARAVVDTCRHIEREQDVVGLVAQVVQGRRVGVGELEEELVAAPKRGTRLLNLAMEELRSGTRSVAEAEARRVVETARLPKAVWNAWLYLPDGTFLACPDAYWVELGVALEVNSWAYHSSPEDLARTERRRLRMTAAGIVVVAVTPLEIREHPDRFIADLRQVIRQRTAAPPTELPDVEVRGSDGGAGEHRSA
ncbi:hypothetical protein [Yinghuangia seranimata]|uniref:hypothetical protein n=1 Tax=Yinghuangia seranimata TaxID=408067 RepID=UPI00248CB2C5|nr:hypothetical protein [Yinghuangia seranimata]MDI2130937.1 hypothetical protein [Yinghuangia seranimata]